MWLCEDVLVRRYCLGGQRNSLYDCTVWDAGGISGDRLALGSSYEQMRQDVDDANELMLSRECADRASSVEAKSCPPTQRLCSPIYHDRTC